MSFDPIAYINEPRWLESRLGLDRIRELLDRLGRSRSASAWTGRTSRLTTSSRRRCL